MLPMNFLTTALIGDGSTIISLPVFSALPYWRQNDIDKLQKLKMDR